MSEYRKGSRIERLVRDHLQEHGYAVIRAAGSKGAADLAAFANGLVLFVSVKRTNALISPAERLALLALAEHVGIIAIPIVATKPIRQPITYRLLTGPGPKDWLPWEPKEIT